MPTKISRLADFVPYLLAITSNAVSNCIAEEYYERFGLKIPEWRVMAVLGDAGALTQRDLVRAILMDKVAVNRACKALEDRGLAARTPNSRDGRSHHLQLTEAGQKIFAQVMPLTQEMYSRVFAGIEDSEREHLKRLLERIRDGVRQLEGEGGQ